MKLPWVRQVWAAETHRSVLNSVSGLMHTGQMRPFLLNWRIFPVGSHLPSNSSGKRALLLLKSSSSPAPCFVIFRKVSSYLFALRLHKIYTTCHVSTTHLCCPVEVAWHSRKGSRWRTRALAARRGETWLRTKGALDSLHSLNTCRTGVPAPVSFSPYRACYCHPQIW